MAATYDYSYRYRGDARCRIRVYQTSGLVVCLATQRQDKWGGSGLTDSAARIATEVEGWHHPSHDGEFIWLEHYEYPRAPNPQGARETFAFVSFQRDGAGELRSPAWQPTERATVEALIGQVVGA